jgi:hypothetical protein
VKIRIAGLDDVIESKEALDRAPARAALPELRALRKRLRGRVRLPRAPRDLE